MYNVGAIWVEGTLGIFESPNMSIEGMSVEVSIPDPDMFYTKYGFAYPLTCYSIRYDAVMDGRQLSSPKGGPAESHRTSQWLVVSHAGDVFTADIWHTEEEGWQFCQYQLPFTAKSRGVVGYVGSDREVIAGVLRITKDRRKIDKIMIDRGIGTGRPNTWLRLDDIVKRLHQLYPKKEEENVTEQKDK